jgi:hypothetical protein
LQQQWQQQLGPQPHQQQPLVHQAPATTTAAVEALLLLLLLLPGRGWMACCLHWRQLQQQGSNWNRQQRIRKHTCRECSMT